MLVEYVSVDNIYGDSIYVGCVVALDKGVVGWSQCNTDKDQFDKKRAREIAIGRAIRGTKSIPRCYAGCNLIGNAIMRMKDRSRSYFQESYKDKLSYKDQKMVHDTRHDHLARRN